MRKIRVIDKSVIRTGTSAGGKDWTLYDVTAVDADGAPIEEKLKSFDDLVGEVEVEVERQEHEKYGVSYMLKLPPGSAGSTAATPSPGARLGPKVDDLRGRIEHLEDQMKGLRTAVEDLKRSAPQLSTAHPEPASPATTRGSQFGDDAPF